MKKSFLCILLACVLALVCGLVACGKTDDNSNGGGDGKLDWAVNANTAKDDMTVSVHCDVKTGESLSGAKYPSITAMNWSRAKTRQRK